MLKEIDGYTWSIEIKNKYDTIFNQTVYLETISKLHQTEIKYFLFYHKNEPVIGFAAHLKRNKIIVPDHYSYSSFWIKETLGEFARFDFIDFMLKELKLKFKVINFRFSPHFYDIRAFNLNEFDAKVKYTYINQNGNIKLRKNLENKLQKTKDLKFIFKYDDFYDEILKQQLADFGIFGYSKKQEAFYEGYFKNLIDRGFIKSFCVQQEDKLIASALILIDFKHSMAYNLLLSTSKTNYSLETTTFLYVKIMEKLSELDINELDLYGADMKGIANYKSGFRGKLKPHYLLRYDTIASFKEKIRNLKLMIKKMLY